MAIVNQKYTPSFSAISGKGMLRTFLLKNSWVGIFIIFCAILYGNGIYKKKEMILSLEQNLNHLKVEKTLLNEKNQDLNLQINSQSDPAWIELVLKKGLGLVPEFQKKVYFYDDP